MKLIELKLQIERQLSQVIVDNPQQISAERNLLLSHFLQVPSHLLIVEPDRDVPQGEALDQLMAALRERVGHRQPIQYLLGEAIFYGLVFKVTPDVLIPRPETELLVEKALQYCQSNVVSSILDVGTGSGCIAVTLKKTHPDIAVTAGDISAEALAIAAQNAKRHGTSITFVQGNGFEPFGELQHFDLIVSNPPYISPADQETLMPEVLNEPHLALFTPDQNPVHFYERLLQGIQNHLSPQGAFLLEVGSGQGESLQEIATRLGFDTALFLDYAGHDRILYGTRTVTG